MEKAKEQNVRFNPGKIQYRQKEVKFLGHLWSKNKTKVDPERVRAIKAIKEPKTKTQLQKCLGIFNYLRKFIPQMATIAAPLYELLSNAVLYKWMPTHAKALQTLKESISKAPVLATFDSKKPIIIQADASQYGLGCCLLQDKKPVVLDSRILTETEKNYAQIEKEMLALCYAAHKFEKYIWGMPDVLFQTDHQPLIHIFKKPIYKITNNRLKKMRLKLLRFQPKVEYLPGKYMHIADLLSRNCLEDPVEDDPEMVEVVHEVTKYIDMSLNVKADLVRETANDPGLSAVMQYYQEGWPKNNKVIVNEVKPYWKLRMDIFVEDKLKIGIDILHFNSKDFLVVEDYLSKWLEIKPLSSKSSKAVIDALRSIFSTHGNPQIIFGDNNPLNSHECHEFAKSMGSVIKTSSPEYARSNGLAEKGVHIAKQMLKKCSDSGTHILDALKEYNNTPLTGMNVSPAEILMSRKCRTLVPILNKNLEPKVVKVKQVLKRLQDKVKSQHDLHANRKPIHFSQGDSVVVRRGKKWQKGNIVRKLSGNRSYVVELLGGGQLRRNTWHLKHSSTKPDRVDARENKEIDADAILANIRAGEKKVTINPNPTVRAVSVPAAQGLMTFESRQTTRFGRKILKPHRYDGSC
ncbi:uncharacterized protein LOC117647704 [Thrips palmi]|uniref:Uncharacterized protein LOC117647704 n=1 Tax=Thrips palmi TaxID=161013 RepID=A0A6P8Z6D0_THRPL|nr:uncharacterized protein LOC117647704 [Thrips palmi]